MRGEQKVTVLIIQSDHAASESLDVDREPGSPVALAYYDRALLKVNLSPCSSAIQPVFILESA